MKKVQTKFYKIIQRNFNKTNKEIKKNYIKLKLIEYKIIQFLARALYNGNIDQLEWLTKGFGQYK